MAAAEQSKPATVGVEQGAVTIPFVFEGPASADWQLVCQPSQHRLELLGHGDVTHGMGWCATLPSPRDGRLLRRAWMHVFVHKGGKRESRRVSGCRYFDGTSLDRSAAPLVARGYHVGARRLHVVVWRRLSACNGTGTKEPEDAILKLHVQLGRHGWAESLDEVPEHGSLGVVDPLRLVFVIDRLHRGVRDWLAVLALTLPSAHQLATRTPSTLRRSTRRASTAARIGQRLR